jgi:hypothetical protein
MLCFRLVLSEHCHQPHLKKIAYFPIARYIAEDTVNLELNKSEIGGFTTVLICR